MNPNPLQALANNVVEQADASAQRLGVKLVADREMIRAYARSRLAHLSDVLYRNEPGYGEVLAIEGSNVGMEALGRALDTADVVDRELLGTIIGALGTAARIAAGG